MNEEALENLVRIHKLHHEAVDANEVQGLIQSGNVRLKDAGLEALSQESRGCTYYRINLTNTHIG